MPTLHIMEGLPGSGKSTLARQLLKSEKEIIRVNRDELRAMLHDSRWSPENEAVTAAAEREIVRHALLRMYSVIVDDCHVTGKGVNGWLEWAKTVPGEKIAVKVHKMTTPLEECIARDASRPKKERVGRGVVERLALFGGWINLSGDRPIAIFDIDGTLSDQTHRLPYILRTDGQKKDYDTFYAAVGSDPLWPRVATLLRDLYKTHLVVLITGRPALAGFDTAQWMHMHQLPYHHLFQRQTGDHRKDTEVKKEILDAMIEKAGMKKSNVDIALDDRAHIVEVWADLGLPVIQVESDRAVRALNINPIDLAQPVAKFLAREDV